MTTLPPIGRRFASTLPFKLDPFQEDAITALEKGSSVLVTAPTGAGKTLIADFAAFAALESGRKLVYTTPIKALSNQKYRQMAAQYGHHSIGLVTGDTVVNRDAPLLVMTTEILRNLLIVNHAPLDDIQFVVIDEVHFLSDRERGVVWEEMIIACPPHIQLVCLSATVRNADELNGWLTSVHGETRLIQHDERPVPLEDYVFHQGKLHLIRDESGRRIKPPRIETQDHYQRGGGRGRRGGRPQRQRPERRVDRQQEQFQETALLMANLKSNKLLPAIYFRFGRRSAESLAWSIVKTEMLPLPSGIQAQDIRDATNRMLKSLGSDTHNLRQVTDLIRLLPHGIAYHHGGLIHPLKMLVEGLFADGLLNVVVATSTLSMGLHLPARAVVVGDLRKFNGQSFEPLTAAEYRQMTGRAGRRGIDTKGAAILVPSPSMPFDQTFQRMSGEPDPLRSAFELRYNTLLNTYHPDDEERIGIFLERNLAEYHRAHQQRLYGIRTFGRPHRPWRSILSAMLDVLTAEHLITSAGDVTLEGQVARHIFNSWEVAIVHLVLDASLAELPPAELALIISLFIPSKFVPSERDRDRGYHARRRFHGREALSQQEEIEYRIESSVARLRSRERRLGIDLTPEWVRPEHSFVFHWCKQGSLKDALDDDLLAGDALQVFGQTMDLIEQIQAAITHVFGTQDPRARALGRAAKALDHDGALDKLLGG